MRKKIVKQILIIILTIVCFANIKQYVFAEEDKNYEFVLEKKVNLQKEEKGVYFNETLYLTYDLEQVKIYSSNGNITIKTKYKDSFYTINSLYIISDTSLYVININLLSYKEIILDIKINDLFVDEYIYLVGHKNNNPCVYLINDNGEIIKNNIYKSSKYGEFTLINKVNDEYILVGKKDAFFDHPDFLKVGNINDIKSFIFMIDKTLQKKNEYYFNEDTNYEEVSSAVVDNNINVILDTPTKQYFYQFDETLDLVNYLSLEGNGYTYIENGLDEVLLLKQEESSFSLGLWDNSFNEIYKVPYYLKGYNMVEGGIVFCYDNRLNIYSEHHIKRKDTLILTRLKYEDTSTSHFEVVSFFEDLYFKLGLYSPYHFHMMSGEYVASYKAVNKLGGVVSIETDVIVKDFVNVIDNGLYNVGTTLHFFGYAELNGERINNGHRINNPGLYELVLTTVNDVSKTYTFEVVDNYYKDNDHYVIDVDYIVNKDDTLLIDFELSSTSNLEYVVIDDKKYDNYQIRDNHVILNINALSEFGYQNIYINGIVFKDKAIIINKDISILTRKDAPTINVFTSSNNNEYQIIINYTDLDQTFVDLYYIKENTKDKTKTYLKDLSSTCSSGSFVLAYELGDGTIHEQHLVSVEGKNFQSKVQFGENEIRINLSEVSDVERIEVEGKNIYINNNDNTNMYIIILTSISSVFIIILTLVALVIKKKRRKVNRI